MPGEKTAYPAPRGMRELRWQSGRLTQRCPGGALPAGNAMCMHMRRQPGAHTLAMRARALTWSPG